MEEPRHIKRSRDRWDVDQTRYHLKKPPAPHREVKTISEILDVVMKGLEQPRSDSVITLEGAWFKMFGEQISKQSRPGFIKNNALYVFVNNPMWISELERNKRVMLSKIQGKYRDMKIRQIRFKIERKS